MYNIKTIVLSHDQAGLTCAKASHMHVHIMC